MDYTLVPYTQVNGEWSLPDHALAYVWREITNQGRGIQTFYDASVTTEQEFIYFMQDKRNLPVFVLDTEFKKIFMVAWLNSIIGRSAQSHFCCIGRYKRGTAEKILSFWSKFKHDDGKPLFLTIIGITPATYSAAIKLLKIAGYQILGTLPNACYMAEQGGYNPGIVSYYCPKEGA